MSRLVDIAKINMGQSPPSSTYNEVGIGLPFYQGKADFGYINPVPKKYCSAPSKIAERGDILISVRAPVGPVNITTENCCIGRGLAAIKAKSFIQDFIYFSLIFQENYIASLGTGSTFKAINKSQLENIQIPDFTLNEQLKVTYVLNTLQKNIEHQNRLIINSIEFKKAFIHRLLTEGTKGEKQKETEIGLVPESWAVKKLIEVVEFIDYGVSQAIPKTAPDKGVKIVSTADINRDGDLLYNQIRTIEVPPRTIDKLRLKNGDLLFNWRNSAELIGKSSVFHEQSEPHIFASFILRINCCEKKSHNNFLKYLMNHYREEGVFIKLSRRAVNQANYNRNEISVLPIPVPPIKEQVEIANLISTVENKINFHKTKKLLLNELFKTLLNELMTGKRRVDEIDFQNIKMENEMAEQSFNITAEI